MKRFPVILTALLMLALLLAACTPTAAVPTAVPTTPPPASFKDAYGNEITLEKPALKVISLAPSNTEILYAVGAGSQVIARDDFSSYPTESTSVPSVGGNMNKYDMEKIASLQPDLILAAPLMSPDQAKALQAVAPNVYVVPNPKDLNELYANLEAVGKMTGHDADAAKLVDSLKAREKAVTDKLAGVSDHPKVFYENDGTDPAKPWTAGPGSFIDVLITMAGGQNVGASLKSEFAQISQEDLIVQNPDIILLGDALYGNVTPEQVAARPGWDGIKAVKDHKVLPFNDDLVSRPGPRLIDGLEALAKALHPDLFK